MPYYKKHIPNNSVTFIVSFDSREELEEAMNSREFQETQGKLANILLAKGGQVDMFTNPKKL